MENDEQNQQTLPPTYQTSDNNNSNEQEQVVQQQPEAALPNSLDEFMQYYTGDIMNIPGEDGGNRISLPLGMRFVPHDQELVYYLMKKITNDPIHNELIKDANLYKKSPHELTAGHDCAIEDVWYFMTSREKKYPKGQRPNRSAGEGFWKATGKDVLIMYKDQTVGFRKALVYQEGNAKQNSKTSWMMHEYTVNPSLLRGHQVTCSSSGSMKLDKYVLCKVYKKKEKNGCEEGSSQHSVSVTSAEVDENQDNLSVTDVKGKATMKGHGYNNNNVQRAPALRIGNRDVNVNNMLGASNCPPQNGVPNGQANLVGMVQLPNATTNMHGNISENNAYQVVNSNWSIGAPGPSNCRPNSAAPANWQNGVSHQSMPGDHNCMPGTSNYPSQNGVPRQFRHRYYNNMPGSSNYHSQNGVPHQFRHGEDNRNNLPGTSNDPPLAIPANRQKRLFDQITSGYHNSNLPGTSNNPPPAYLQNRDVRQTTNYLPGTSNNQPPVALANQQNRAPNQFMNGDHKNNVPGSSNNHHPVAPANQQNRVAHQFNNGDHSNNLPGSSNNHHHPVAPANQQNRVAYQFNNGDHSNNLPGSSNNHHHPVAPANQQNRGAHQFNNGDHSNNVPGTSNNHHPPVAPANKQNRAPNQFNNADHSNNVPGSSNYHYSQNGVPNDQLMDPNYPQHTPMPNFNPFAAREGNLTEGNGDDDEQTELTEEDCAFLRENFIWNGTD